MISVNKINKHKGSIILAVLSMATLSSIALFTMMFSIKSLSRTLTLESVQNNAQQLLLIENNKTISNYIQNPALSDVSNSSQIIAGGIEYTYRQYPGSIQDLKVPLPGFSLNSNYASRLVKFKSQVSRENIQSPTLHTGIACVDVINEELNSNVMDLYELEYTVPKTNAISYDFNSITGEIWRNTATTSKLIMDFDFESYQHFSRADFAMLKVSNKIKFALIFAVTETATPGLNNQNNLYVLFDKIAFDQPFFPPLSKDKLITLTSDYSPTGDEDGFIVPLSIEPIQLSAITTIHNTIIFIKQLKQVDPLTSLTTQQNTTLYQINFGPDSNQTSSSVVKTRLLSVTKKSAKLKTTLVNQTEILLSSESESHLLRFPIQCKQVYQYEE